MDTGFRATYGSDSGFNVCLICEYDALPEIGHACGHNLIAELGLAAGIAVKAGLEMNDGKDGKVSKSKLIYFVQVLNFDNRKKQANHCMENIDMNIYVNETFLKMLVD